MIGSKKYRPYFTGPELKEVISCLKERPSPFRLGIIQYLETFQIKMERGVIRPAHTIEGTKNQKIEANLGFSTSTPRESGNFPELPSKELHKIWMDEPDKLSPPDIERVMRWRFEEKLMTPEEEKSYISALY